ncbi:MAG: TniQ family protein [Acetobacteraceae bacterium]|nr:TniQ family protein [Acetobacteraceae bacterium]
MGLLPSKDESLESFIFRLARIRRVEAPSRLASRTCMPNPWTRVTLDGLMSLAAEADVPMESLMPLWRGNPDDPFVLFWNSRLPLGALDWRITSGRKVCPACLHEAGRHLAVWDLSFISACPVHRARLVDTCPSCDSALTWRGSEVTRCGCGVGGDLTRIWAEPVSPEQAHATACVQGLLGDERFAAEAAVVRALPPFQAMVPNAVIEFLFRLGLEATATRPRRYFFGFERMGDYDVPSHEVLAQSLAAVRDWPAGFHAVLDHLRRRHVTDLRVATQKVTESIVRWATPLPRGGGKEVLSAVTEWRRAARLLPGYVPLVRRPG